MKTKITHDGNALIILNTNGGYLIQLHFLFKTFFSHYLARAMNDRNFDPSGSSRESIGQMQMKSTGRATGS